MKLAASIPDEFVGDVIGNLDSHRGRAGGVEAHSRPQQIKAQGPMAEVLSYASDLMSLTRGQSSFTMEFSHDDEAPRDVQDKVIADAKARIEQE